MKHRGDQYTRLALQILDGLDARTIPRYSPSAMVDEKEIVDARRERDAAVKRKQSEWLRGVKIE